MKGAVEIGRSGNRLQDITVLTTPRKKKTIQSPYYECKALHSLLLLPLRSHWSFPCSQCLVILASLLFFKRSKHMHISLTVPPTDIHKVLILTSFKSAQRLLPQYPI